MRVGLVLGVSWVGGTGSRLAKECGTKELMKLLSPVFISAVRLVPSLPS